MLRSILVSALLMSLFSGCGGFVQTDSSARKEASSNTTTDGNETSTDDNTTDDTNSTTGGSVVIDLGNSGTGIFDQVDATLDEVACKLDTTYSTIDDSSFDPLSAADTDNGVEIASKVGFTADLDAASVVLFYPLLKVAKEEQKVYIYEDLYNLGVDKAWGYNTIQKVYIRTPKNSRGFYECYRYELGSLETSKVTRTKVYR